MHTVGGVSKTIALDNLGEILTDIGDFLSPE